MLGLLRPRRHERTAHELYCIAVAAARNPWFYEQLGVPDTLDGRFDMVGLYTFLLIRRLQAVPVQGAALAQAVFDAMFSDMDTSLREMGVGDLGVGKRVRSMWEAFHGRSVAYHAPLSQADQPALAAALARNVWRDPGSVLLAGRLARVAMAQDRHLSQQADAALAGGQTTFLSPESIGA